MILVWLLETNYTLNILVFLYWLQIILGTFLFFFTGGQVANTLFTHTICLLNIPNNSLYNASNYICRKITSHWHPLFSKKKAAAASFSYKIGGGGLIFVQNWRRRPHFLTKLAAARIWQHYWRLFWHGLDIGVPLVTVSLKNQVASYRYMNNELKSKAIATVNVGKCL